MSLRGLDEWITGHYGEDCDMPSSPQFDEGFVCDSCRERACGLCNNKHCACPGKYGKSARTHGPYDGPVKLVIDNPGASLNDGKKD